MSFSLRAALWLLPSAATLHLAGAPRPNLIFVLCDDLGYGDVGVFFQNARAAASDRSEPWHLTPQLDSIAAEGARMPHHYCPAPVCAPSRASLLLGVHQGHANVRDNQFDKALENNHTLATVLKGAGYDTACIGKWGLQGSVPSGQAQPAWPAYPLNRGFDYYYGYVSHAAGHEHYPKEGKYDGPKDVWDNLTEVSAGLDKCYTSDLFTARAKKWIVDQRASHPSQPFFLYLALDTPHAVLELPTQAYPAGGGLTGGLQWKGTPGSMINTASGTIDSYYHPSYASATYDHDNNASTAEVAWPDVYKRYATCVRRIDDCMGDLRKTLQDLGIDNNTLVVFTTDNGPSKESYLAQAYDPDFFNSFGPFDGIKRDCWEGGIRVGAIARWPGGIPANRVDNNPSQFHDWMPTFAELAGVAAPARADGVSLLPALTGVGTQKPGTTYVEYFEGGTTPAYTEFQAARRSRDRNQMQMIRVGDYVGVRYDITAHSNPFEIYDIVADPGQRTNLAASQSALQQQMKDSVLRLRRPNSSAARPYDAEAIPAANPSPVTGGVFWKAWSRAFPWVPRGDDLVAEAAGAVASPSLTVRPRDNDIGLVFNGYLNVPAEADYTFYLTADTGALLRLHEATLLDADFAYAGGSEVSGTVKLKAGRHPFKLHYRRGSAGVPALSLKWSSATIAKQTIPDSAYFRDGSGPVAPPVAVDDNAATGQDTAVTIPVLSNDTDDGTPQPLSLQSVGQPAHGTATLLGSSVRYTPAAGFLGLDSFTYVVTDGAQADTGTVRVNVSYDDGSYWFPFNQSEGLTTLDAGGAKTATLNGFTADPAQWVAGKSDRGVIFDNVDDHLTVDNFTGFLGTSARTCAAWIRTTASGGNKPIIAWGPNTAGNKWIFLMNTTGQIRTEITSGFVVGTKAVNDGQWHHVACTFENDGSPNAADIKLYVDGALETISSSTAFALNTTASGNVRIGSDVQSRFWNGTMDDVRLYPRALTAGEIAALASLPETSSLAWHRRNFGPAPVDWGSDDDGDGVPRLLEYALGGRPWGPDGQLSPVPVETAGRLRWTFPRRLTGTHSVLYQVQCSSDLATWNLPATQVSATPLDSEFESVTYEVEFPVGGSRLFYRLQTTLP